MERIRLNTKTLLIYPNGKFILCADDEADRLAQAPADELPNFTLSICGGAPLTLGNALHFRGLQARGDDYLLQYDCPQHHLSVTTVLRPLPQSDLIVQTNSIRNAGERPVTLTGFSSAFLDHIAVSPDMPWYQNDSLRVHICHSSWQCEGQWRTYTPKQLGLCPATIHPFERECHSLISTGSRSTERYYPLAMIDDARHGRTWFLETEGSHNWSLHISALGGYARPTLALEATGCDEANGGWHYELLPNERYTCERAFWGLADSFEDAVAALTAFKRADSAVRFPNGVLPVVFNDYMNCVWSQQSPALLLPLIDRAAEVGAEIFCIDGGWCETVGGTPGIGDWLPRRDLFGTDGLRALAEHIRARGMLPGIWLELESCRADAFGATLDDDCVLKRYGAPIGEVLTYNFRNEAVCRYLTDRVAALYDMGFRYIKNDYNHSFGIGATNDSLGSSPAQGSIENANAFCAFLDSLYARFPDLIVENCGGGAMRCDNKMLRRCYLQSTSDQELYRNAPSIVIGSSALMPPEKAGIWAYPYPSLFPYDEHGRYIPFVPSEAYRREMADGRQTVFNLVSGMCGFLYLSGRIDLCDDRNLRLIRDGVAFYKQLRHLIPRSRPIYPLGIPPLGAQTHAALGLLSDDALLLAVWNLTRDDRVVTVPLKPERYGAFSVAQTFPPDATAARRPDAIDVTLRADSAAFLVLRLNRSDA